jgi:hypothetical protein
MTGGMSATMLMDYVPHLGHSRMAELLNVRYTLRQAGKTGSGEPVFSDGVWSVYENPRCGERAWVVHEIEIDPSKQRPLPRLDDADFDPRRSAILEEPLLEPIEPPDDARSSVVDVIRYEPTSVEFRVQSGGRGLLVASEVFYPGWQAFVNEREAPIYRVNGFMRGVVVPGGESMVRFEYRPASIRFGAVLSVSALLGTALLGLSAGISRLRSKSWI